MFHQQRSSALELLPLLCSPPSVLASEVFFQSSQPNVQIHLLVGEDEFKLSAEFFLHFKFLWKCLCDGNNCSFLASIPSESSSSFFFPTRSSAFLSLPSLFLCFLPQFYCSSSLVHHESIFLGAYRETGSRSPLFQWNLWKKNVEKGDDCSCFRFCFCRFRATRTIATRSFSHSLVPARENSTPHLFYDTWCWWNCE